MLYLEIQVASEPIIEEILFNIAGCVELQLQPGLGTVQVNLHGDVVGLGHPGKPVALQAPGSGREHETMKNEIC